jgi:aminocarboxymuconate-semialdehyde decarboxylase
MALSNPSKTTPAKIIDVHCHLYPLEYMQLLEKRQSIPRIINRNGEREFLIFPEEDGPNGVGGRPMGREYFDLEQKLKCMDELGIQTSVVSLGNPWLDPFADASGDEAAEVINQKMSGYEALTSGRIVALGVLPASSAEKATQALRRIAAMPGLHGVVSRPAIAGLLFDDPRLEPFWNELERLGLPLFVHPENGAGLDALEGYRHTLPVGIGFPMETTIGLTRLIFGGVLERHPALKVMGAHGGGCLPYLAGRLDAAWQSDDEVRRKVSQAPSLQMKQLYLDALVYIGPALQAARQLIGAEHLLFGTDQPFSVSDPCTNIEMLREELADANELDAVMNRNAMELFRL